MKQQSTSTGRTIIIHMPLSLSVLFAIIVVISSTVAAASPIFPKKLQLMLSDSSTKDDATNTSSCASGASGASASASGAINEKPRTFRQKNHDTTATKSSSSSSLSFSSQSHAHLLFALEGLDRYPNYLHRWNDHDIDELEFALQNQLQKVQQQRREIQARRAAVQESFLTNKRKQQTTTKTAAQQAHVHVHVDEEEKEQEDHNTSSLSPPPHPPPTAAAAARHTLLERPKTWQQVEQCLDPALAHVIFQSKFFTQSQHQKSQKSSQQYSQQQQLKSQKYSPPTVDQVLSGNVMVELDAHLLEEMMDQEMYDVYSFPLLRPDFCDMLRNYIQQYHFNTMIVLCNNTNKNHENDMEPSSSSTTTSTTTAASWNSISQTPATTDFDTIGLEWIADLLFHLIIRPLSRHLFKDTECAGGDLDWRQAYVASYAAAVSPTESTSTTTTTTRNRLVAHTDDSEVTLNVGLGDIFEGGLLEFWGLRGEAASQRLPLVGEYEPIKGRAVIHAGRHLHSVTKVTQGDRYALIVWARSWKTARRHVCPCCWMNRRKDNVCICGPRWN